MNTGNKAQSASSLSSPEDEANDGIKRRFFTSHRQNIDRIQQDCASGNPIRHSVHNPKDDEYSQSQFGGPESWIEKHRDNIKKTFQQKSFCFRKVFNESHLAFRGLSTKVILLSGSFQ